MLAEYIRMGALNGIGIKETLFETPGVIFDMFELYVRAHTTKKEKGEDYE
nr:MAG TPA: hypothetical protein [Caudoviricetes sp.]